MNEKLCFLNSFYCPVKHNKDSFGKYFVEREDFLMICIKNCDTGETILKFIEKPTIEFYVTKNPNESKYQMMSMEEDKLYKVKCLYRDRDKTMAKELNLLNEFYDACKMGRQLDPVRNYEINFKNKFIQEMLYNSPRLYMADIDLEDYYKNVFMEKYGVDTYNKYGSFKHGFMDIEVDQYKDNWNADDLTGPINSISYYFKPDNKLYLFVLNNQPENDDLLDVFRNKEKFINEYIKPHAHDEINYELLLYNTETELLIDFWKIIHITKPDFVGIWNMNFDIPYILNRMKILNIDIYEKCCHPDVPKKYRYIRYIEDSGRKNRDFSNSNSENKHPSRLWDWVYISGYTQFYDMMALYSILRKRSILPSYKLEDIATNETGYGKLDYRQYGYTIRKLAHQNFKIFLSYSAIDTIRLMQIEKLTDDLNRAIIFSGNTKIQNSQKISVVIKNKLYKIYRDSEPRKIIGNNVSYNVKATIDGAIIASPNNIRRKGFGILNSSGYIYEDIVDFDEAAEYPRTILAFNISKNSLKGRFFKLIIKDEEDKILDIINETDYVFDFNKHLQTADSSIFYLGEKYFGLPKIEDIIKEIEHRALNKK